MSFLARSIEEGDILYHAEAQCASESLVDVGSVRPCPGGERRQWASI